MMDLLSFLHLHKSGLELRSFPLSPDYLDNSLYDLKEVSLQPPALMLICKADRTALAEVK